ncbi:phosphoribosylformylglycinamidine synthase, clade II [Treponema sp. JC4]|uniref:phosphoribosylformylglycinamidine synthase n=1 Tax=Treponema sp. JC4 TaxID=1124982 RepID=UPI00025B0C01|nr:phosphoribosylformylglycinamidine synthase [Treponema sp. JC4]EID85578.1 phosphoribosylformylglycinamidine synthase, clade II [Treponema sp. JC4]
MYRLYVERRAGFENEARRYLSEINSFLGISSVTGVRYFNRYDVENVSDEVAKIAATRIFSEPQSDLCFTETLDVAADETEIVWEYLPGQYDQRADSAEQCISLLRAGLTGVKTNSEPPVVRCAKIVLLKGKLSASDVEKIQNYLVNPVDSRLTDETKPETLKMQLEDPADIPVVEGFIKFDDKALEDYRVKMGLAMDHADIKFLQDYFIGEKRDPTETEIRVLDTYWSDHCRHTTFLTELKDIKIEDGPYSDLFKKSLDSYNDMRSELYAGRTDKPVCLMDMAVIGMKYLKKQGKLEDMEVSEENNACSVYIDVHYTTDENGKPLASDDPRATERWLMMFKNETHNHPTEIEPFGGAATCLGGAIRDPLSGRSWVYQSMRITGASDPTVPLAATLKGKLPQVKICREAAQGFSSYGNQIGLTTGQVAEIYHPGYVAKRMELGAVIAAAPVDTVIRERPEAGDIIILLGGGTGRDGIGGATGSSKVHTVKSVTTAAAEVQKGNAVEERKIQRLFRNKEVSLMIRRCNDFGAGGVSVAVGELAPGLDINLDAVPKKYEGLNGTELAISESQERMAVVVRKSDVDRFINEAKKENLNAVVVATVTDTNRLVMKWRGNTIVNIGREFLDAAGAHHEATALIESPAEPEKSPLLNPLDSVSEELNKGVKCEGCVKNHLTEAWLKNISDLACCSQRGLGERFDGSIGASTVLFPYGGKYQNTPEAGMSAKIPVMTPRETSTASLMTYGFDPRVGNWSPWHGAKTAVLSSLAKITCIGGKARTSRLSFQEFFGRAVNEKRWGYPAAALLGSVNAQIESGCASIGGKDSMSGTFEDINVPHTLVSFAVTHDEAKNVVSGAFKKAGNSIYLVSVPYSSALDPDYETFLKNSDLLYELNKAGKISAMYPVAAGGIAEAVTKMAMGNMIGAELDAANGVKSLFVPTYGNIVVETSEALENAGFAAGTLTKLGKTSADAKITVKNAELGGITNPSVEIALSDCLASWENTLKEVFPRVSGAEVQPELPEWAKSVHKSLSNIRKAPAFVEAKSHPKVLLPVFPGTNCEIDMARAFNLAGANTKILVLRNKNPEMLNESLDELARELKDTQILALSGGFSAGDEPDGSAKFIANVLKAGKISEEVMNLLKKRAGLVLGICNGFQALVKTGLAVTGEICDMTPDMPTLTYNRIGRHISRIVRTRIVSAATPWAMHPSVVDGRNHLIAISHGEGRFVCDKATAEKLFKNGQVFSQYVDEKGLPAITEPDNPNGSAFAIEGICSPDGHVLGKMGHNERGIGMEAGGASLDLFKNVVGNPLTNADESTCENIFAAGVAYFKN